MSERDDDSDEVTPAQRAYTSAFVQWFRTRSDTDLQRREKALQALLTEPER